MDCKIRPWRAQDEPELAQIMNSKRVQDNLRDGLPLPYTETDAKAFINSVQAAPPGEIFAFAIEADGRVAGSISVFRQGNIHRRTAEMGYCLAEAWWGKGLGTRAVQEATAFVFQNSDILRIYAEPFSRNTASCRVLEKAGFTCEGILRKNAVKNGIVEDMRLYAIIKETEESGG